MCLVSHTNEWSPINSWRRSSFVLLQCVCTKMNSVIPFDEMPQIFVPDQNILLSLYWCSSWVTDLQFGTCNCSFLHLFLKKRWVKGGKREEKVWVYPRGDCNSAGWKSSKASEAHIFMQFPQESRTFINLNNCSLPLYPVHFSRLICCAVHL